MPKIKPLFVVFLAIVIIFALVIIANNSLAKAEKPDNPGKGNQEGIATDSDDDDELASDSEETASGQANAALHRSVVANFVQSLLRVASRSEGGIGEQVREVAREQNMAKERVAENIEVVQHRSKIKTFLIGSDYKNLGQLRSEMVQTRNRIEQLNRTMEQVENEGDKTELQEQIQTLEQEQTRLENFIKDQEGKFSLFGWLVKLFVK